MANDVATKKLWGALGLRTSQEKINKIKQQIADGADVNDVDEYGRTPLIYACTDSCIDEVLVLLEAGASVLFKNKDGKTALDFAKDNDTADKEKIIALLEETPEGKQRKAEEEKAKKEAEEARKKKENEIRMEMLESNEHSVQEMLFLVLNELRDMKAKETIANNEKGGIKNIIVTTGDIKCDYEILGPVYFQINNRPINLSGKSKLAIMEEQYKQLADNNTEKRSSIMSTIFLASFGEFGPNDHKFKTAFYIAVEELKKQAEDMGGDAVIAMRQDIDIDSNGFQYFYLQMYGTAVKYK